LCIAAIIAVLSSGSFGMAQAQYGSAIDDSASYGMARHSGSASYGSASYGKEIGWHTRV
jgi:hypothetical protein